MIVQAPATCSQAKKPPFGGVGGCESSCCFSEDDASGEAFSALLSSRSAEGSGSCRCSLESILEDFDSEERRRELRLSEMIKGTGVNKRYTSSRQVPV